MLATKENVARLSIFSISLLIVMKVVASIVTGSVAIRADAVHSVIDLSGVIIGYIGIRVSSKPPDREHAFGHGKAEHIAGGIIAGLIFVAAGIIFYQAIRNLISGSTVELVTVGIYVTLAAIVINGLVSWFSLKVARAADSLALEATAKDLLADVMSSVAVLIGLILVRLTGLNILDSIVALLVSVLIAVTAFSTMRKSISGLMDTSLPKAEEDEIISSIREHTSQLAGFHKVRTRKAGNSRFVDLHLMLPKNSSLDEAHQWCDHLEQDIKYKLPNCSVTIHVEPCTTECGQCLISACNLRINISAGKEG